MFQLYVANDVPCLDQLAVGENGAGQLVVGGVVEATVLTINNQTNMTDLNGNYIYFIPKSSPIKVKKRQAFIDDDPTLQYAPVPPINAVKSGFALKIITLSAITTYYN